MAKTDMEQWPFGELTVAREQFIQERDLLLAPKPDQSARGVATDLVRAMELIALYGSTGIGGDPDTREEYIEGIYLRIIGTQNIRPVFERAFRP